VTDDQLMALYWLIEGEIRKAELAEGIPLCTQDRSIPTQKSVSSLSATSSQLWREKPRHELSQFVVKPPEASAAELVPPPLIQEL